MTSYSDLPSAIALGSTDFHSLHVFRDNSFMAVGTNGKIYYYSPTASQAWNDETPTAVPSYSTYAWTDIDARDDRTMWAVGNSSGGAAIIKVIDPVNIQPVGPTYTVTPIGSSWTVEPIADGVTANNIVTAPTQVRLYTIAFSGPYDGFVGGSYSSSYAATGSASGYPYARLLSDQGGMFGTMIFYDRLGRQIINQSTKQHNYKRPAYTYSILDALNRIIETGQKTENTDGNTFSTIFGDTILGFYNPNVISLSKFSTWIKDNTGPRTEVVKTFYDVQDILPTNVLTQQQIRNRVVTTTYSDTLRSDSLYYNNATHYSYDVHGSVNTIIQDNPSNGITSQRYKRVDYSYDLISDNVNQWDYQNDSLDQYHHKYDYDADNRLTSVFTSKDSINWDNDANYFYYAHGDLARIEIGNQQVQGLDYAYNLQGWNKGVNSNILDGNHDMGHDGQQINGNLNRYFARDAVGYTLDYFDKSSLIPGDYDAISSTAWNNVANRFEAYTYGSNMTNSRHDLFNGDITGVVTTITQPQSYSKSNMTQQPIISPQGVACNYDQLGRLIDTKAYRNLDPINNIWLTNGLRCGMYNNWLTYDANGNILTQKRADSLGNVFDSLTYRYNIEGGRTLQNRLYHVNNAISGTVDGITNNIKDEGTFDTAEATINQKNNYRYNALGQIAKDSLGGIDTIIWTSIGKIWKIRKYNGDSLIFGYDSKKQKILKEYKPATGNLIINTYYVRGADGKILAIYVKKNINAAMTYSLIERDIFGRDRLGIENTPIQLIGAIPISQIDTFNCYLGLKHYEITNYLGNVLAVVSDRKIPRPNTAGDSINHYEPDLLSANDYYPFGMLEPGRNFNSASYRYGFNRQEKIDGITGFTGTDYEYEYRMFDDRLGRFMSKDPFMNQFPSYSPYQFAKNSPLLYIDIEGLQALNTNLSCHTSKQPVLVVEASTLTGSVTQTNIEAHRPGPEWVASVGTFLNSYSNQASGSEAKPQSVPNPVTSVTESKQTSSTQVVQIDGVKFLKVTSTVVNTTVNIAPEVESNKDPQYQGVVGFAVQVANGDYVDLTAKVSSIVVTTTTSTGYEKITSEDKKNGTVTLSTNPKDMHTDVITNTNTYKSKEDIAAAENYVVSPDLTKSVAEACEGNNTGDYKDMVEGMKYIFSGDAGTDLGDIINNATNNTGTGDDEGGK